MHHKKSGKKKEKKNSTKNRCQNRAGFCEGALHEGSGLQICIEAAYTVQSSGSTCAKSNLSPGFCGGHVRRQSFADASRQCSPNSCPPGSKCLHFTRRHPNAQSVVILHSPICCHRTERCSHPESQPGRPLHFCIVPLHVGASSTKLHTFRSPRRLWQCKWNQCSTVVPRSCTSSGCLRILICTSQVDVLCIQAK